MDDTIGHYNTLLKYSTKLIESYDTMGVWMPVIIQLSQLNVKHVLLYWKRRLSRLNDYNLIVV